jgi:large subunit ribosomal protein L24
MSKVHVKTGDTVILLTGKYEDKYDKNGDRKTGKVAEVSPKEGKVIVEGINIVTKHAKPRRQGETGGIVKVEGAMYADKVQLYCNKCGKGVRAAAKIVDGKKVRVCAKCGEIL